MSNTIASRIRQLREKSGMSKTAFAEFLDINRTTLNTYEEGKSEPGYNSIKQIVHKCNVSYEWLIEGKRDKLSLAGEPNSRYFLKNDKEVASQQIPLYDIEATAGIVALFNDTKEVDTDEYISVPRLPKCDGAVTVTGDSMYPLLKSGDIVAYKKITDIQNEIFWGEMYLISAIIGDEEYVTVKYVQKSDKGDDFIRLVSYNKHHNDKDLQIHFIKAMALIKASIRINSMS